MARRSDLRSNPLNISKVWTDDLIQLDDNNIGKMIKTEHEVKNIVLPRQITVITYQIVDGPSKGSFVVRSYFPEDDLKVVEKEMGLIARFKKWRQRSKFPQHT